MSENSLYEVCKADVTRTTKRDFQKKYPGHFFLGEVPQDIPDFEPDFHTGITSAGHIKSQLEGFKGEEDKESDRLKPGNFLVLIEKKEENEWLLWLSVGRTRNNDVVLRHSSISKLHARIYKEEPYAEEEGEARGEFRISDTGSSLGTWVNGKKLAKSESCNLFSQDIVKFGKIECYFLDSASLYDKFVS